MSLSGLGQQHRDRQRTTAQDAAQKRFEQECAASRESIEKTMRAQWNKPERVPELEDVEIIYINRVRYEYPVSHPQSFGGRRIVWQHRTVYRFKVDDVIVRVFSDTHNDRKTAVEVRCRECGEATSPSEASEYSGYVSNLIEAVAGAQGREWTCPRCALHIPRECPECGRPNSRAL